MSAAAAEAGRIVAGFDGSDPSAEALGWAVRQALLTDCTLEVVMTWEWPNSLGWAVPIPEDFDPESDVRKVQTNLEAADEIARLPQRARQVVEYRKSGLSLNHIQGCPADCAYCIRHTYGIWDMRQPRALMSDAEAVEQLVENR